MTDLIQARDDITDAVDRALSIAAKEASEHVHQLDALKARVAELEARGPSHTCEWCRRAYTLTPRHLMLPERDRGVCPDCLLHCLYRRIDGSAMTSATSRVGYAYETQMGRWVDQRKAVPQREVVRGKYRRYGIKPHASMAEPGGDPSGDIGRTAVMWEPDRWTLYRDGASVVAIPVSEAQAIAWCLDGTLPKPVDGPVDLG